VTETIIIAWAESDIPDSMDDVTVRVEKIPHAA